MDRTGRSACCEQGCSRLSAGIAGSIPAGGKDGRFWSLLCVVYKQSQEKKRTRIGLQFYMGVKLGFALR